MTFSMLSTADRAYLISLPMIAFILLLISISVNLQGYGKKRNALVPTMFFALAVFDTTALMEINRYNTDITKIFSMEALQKIHGPYDLEFSVVGQFADSFHYGVHIAIAVISIIIAICYIYLPYKKWRTVLNPFSIKEAIENLPLGLGFCTEDGTLSLSNRTLHRLSIQMTNKDLQNGNELWSDVVGLIKTEICVLQGEAPAFILSDGSVWQFSRAFFKTEGRAYYEIKASDITEMYRVSEKMSDATETLKQQQKRLIALIETKSNNVTEQVALDTRIRFHDSFGNLLITTKKILNEPRNTMQTQTILDHWAGMTDLMALYTKQVENEALSLEQIKILAEKLHCEMEISGIVPEKPELRQIVLLAINEALKNAVFHGKADKITVDLSEDKQKYMLLIHNKSENPPANIKEGGGLSGLREKTERLGGVMEIKHVDGVTICISLPKECQNWKVY